MSTSSSPLDQGDPTRVGSIFAGKYRIEAVLGRGGMGVVLAARHLGLDEPVAIKVLLPAMMRVSGMVERFTREARSSAKIKNDHVVRVTDVDALPSGVPYIVMERLDGVDLSAHIENTGRLPVEVAVRYLLEACSAIGEAHAMGIVHRDLKPANLFLARRRDGTSTIKVLDFGISKVMDSRGEYAVTVAGTVLGSPSYMSPEQINSLRDIDGRIDLWALGVILYQLLTGTLPFPAESLTHLCSLVLQSEPQRPSERRPDVPPGLDAVVLRCLEKDRNRRFSTAGELAAALLPFAGLPAQQTGALTGLQPITSPPRAPATPSQSAPAMTDSASIASVVTTHGARARSAGRIAFLAVTLGLIGVASAGILWHQASPRPNLAPAAGTPTTEAPTPLPRAIISAVPVVTAEPREEPNPLPSVQVSVALAKQPVTTALPPPLPPKPKAAPPPAAPSASAQAKPPKKNVDPSEIQ